MNERDRELANQVQWSVDVTYGELQEFADLIRADERESIAQMFENAPALVPFAQNDKGGCMICGFTPKLAMESIRARGNT
jgi:hypothetical protein